MTTPLPVGFGVVLDADAKELADGLWFGGSPARVLRLTLAGRDAWQQLRDGPVDSTTTGTLARKLVDAGLAHPCPPPQPGAPGDVTVVIPAHGRPDMLDRCLAALGTGLPVAVVDDASPDPQRISEVVSRHGATLLRRPYNGGPGAARNTALDRISSEFVAFVDSDCVPSPDWIEQLLPHFLDPLVAAVAPRVTGLTASGVDGDSGLDLGARPARVAPNTRVSFVPTAALVVRRAALARVAGADGVFDPALRVGEDVDLIWRLHEAGWTIRYEPSVQVAHEEPQTRAALVGRRFRYGTSAATLALRHPRAVPPLVLHPWPALTVLALLARRPLLAAAAFAMAVGTMHRTLRRADIPTRGVLRAMATAVHQTWLGVGHYGVQFASPVLVAAIIAPGRRWPSRVAAASLLFGPAVTAAATRRRRSGPVRFVLGNLADDIAYGCGVLAGCLRHGTAIPVLPVVKWRPLRIDKPPVKPEVRHGQ